MPEFRAALYCGFFSPSIIGWIRKRVWSAIRPYRVFKGRKLSPDGYAVGIRPNPSLPYQPAKELDGFLSEAFGVIYQVNHFGNHRRERREIIRSGQRVKTFSVMTAQDAPPVSIGSQDLVIIPSCGFHDMELSHGPLMVSDRNGKRRPQYEALRPMLRLDRTDSVTVWAWMLPEMLDKALPRLMRIGAYSGFATRNADGASMRVQAPEVLPASLP